MGLTKTTTEELCMMFNPKIIEFLSRSELVQALPKSTIARAAPVAPTQEQPVWEQAGYGMAMAQTAMNSRGSHHGQPMQSKH